ncbi:MAG: M23 family metallopeptidase [Acidimicrobiaceae bacterium]|nr:M23 family metallopeptidase [Acidimicrobiaceae bacterium]
MDIAPALSVITQNFGCTDFPEYWVAWCPSYMHYGIDLSSGDASWKPQYATRHGTVYVAGPAVVPGQPGLGTAVVITCDEGVDMLYGHLWEVNVAPGQRVSPGDVIGWTGSTGYSTGPHAHIEVRQQGNLNASPNGVLDPWPYLTFAGEPESAKEGDDKMLVLFAVGGGTYLSDGIHYRWVVNEWDVNAIHHAFPSVRNVGEINGFAGMGVPADPGTASLSGQEWPPQGPAA